MKNQGLGPRAQMKEIQGGAAAKTFGRRPLAPPGPLPVGRGGKRGLVGSNLVSYTLEVEAWAQTSPLPHSAGAQLRSQTPSTLARAAGAL